LSYTREVVVSPALGPAHAWRSAWRRTYKASPRSVKAAWRPVFGECPASIWCRPTGSIRIMSQPISTASSLRRRARLFTEWLLRTASGVNDARICQTGQIERILRSNIPVIWECRFRTSFKTR